MMNAKQNTRRNQRNRFTRIAISIIALISLLPATGVAENTATARPLNVVVSFSILADMTRAVAGDAAEVTALVGPNSDAHVFEPSPTDAKRVASADLVILNGLHFEGWIC